MHYAKIPQKLQAAAVTMAAATTIEDARDKLKELSKPMALWGTQRLWCYDKRSSIKQYGVPVEIFVGAPIDASGDPEQATARLRESVIDLVAQAQANYPDDGAGQWWQAASRGGTAPVPGPDD